MSIITICVTHGVEVVMAVDRASEMRKTMNSLLTFKTKT